MNLADSIFTDERATAEYWLSLIDDSDTVLLTKDERQRINKQIRAKDESLTDLTKFPKILGFADLKERILKAEQNFRDALSVGEHYDIDGSPVSEKDFKIAKENLNLKNLTESNIVKFAVTKRRANLRLLPTAKYYFDMQDFRHYDDLQGTTLDPLEPVAALHTSLDGKFTFVCAGYYSGWISRDAFTFVNRDSWLKYVAPEKFWVATENKTVIDHADKKLLFQMGSVIPLGEIKLESDKYFNKGYLPYSQANFIRQSFKFLGDDYDWGGMEESVDCSSLVRNIYKSMGIELPRDADCQEIAMPVSINLNGMSTSERYEELSKAPIGALLFKAGHVMMYLGRDKNGTPAAIHALSSYFDFQNGKYEKKYLRRVVVSDLTLKNAQNVETIDTLTSIGYIASDDNE